jgi:hypothetical protein
MSLQEENEDLRQEKMPRERIFLKSSKNMMILSCRKDGNIAKGQGS